MQIRAICCKLPTTMEAILVRKKDNWYIHVIIEIPLIAYSGSAIMGIGFGIRIEGQDRKQFKEKGTKIRSRLLFKNKKVLQRLLGYEYQRIKHENYFLSKQLVNEAKRYNCSIIRREQLQRIRNKTKTWNKHINRMVSGWSFYQL